MSDLDEKIYRFIESTIDAIDYIVPMNATVYLADYRAIYTREHLEERKTPAKYVLKNGVLTWEGPKVEQVKVPQKPGLKTKIGDDPEELLMRYAIIRDTKPLKQASFEMVEVDGKPRHITTIPRGWSPGTEVKPAFLTTEPRFADMIYDDAAEMNATGFTWGRAINALSEELRRDLFEKNLHEQKDMPQLPINGREWIRQLAQYGTYDSDGNYFNKWANKKPGVKRMHTDKYNAFVGKNRRELVLKKGLPYVFVVSKDSRSVIYSIASENGIATAVTPHMMTAGSLWQLPTFNENTTRQFDVIFITTMEGGKAESKGGRSAIYHLKDRDQASHEVIDPRKLVEAALGDEVTKTLGISDGDEWGWFTQMCAALFQEPYYTLDLNQARATNGWVKKFGADKLADETRKFMEKVWKEQGPDTNLPITQRARARMRDMWKNPNTLVIPQGFPSSKNTRFIGTDGYYAFDRDLENGFVYVMPNYEYIGALAQGKFYADLYDDVAWLVPMMEITAFIAAYAVGGWAMAARKFVTKEVAKKVGKEIIKDAIRAVRPALVSVLIDVVLDLVTKPAMHLFKKLDEIDGDGKMLPWDDAEKYVELWQEFLRGFFDGYIVLNLEGRVTKLQDMIMPTEAKAVLIASRLYELVQKFRDFLERTQGFLTDGAIAKILHNVNQAASYLLRGFASLLSTLYYADIEQVKPLLEVFGADEKAPSPDEWAKLSQTYYASILEKLEKVSKQADSLQSLLDIGLKTKGVAIGAAIGLGYISFLTKAAGLSSKTKWVYVIAGLAAVGAVVYKGGGEELVDVTVELAKEVGRMFPGRDKKAAKLNGQLIGKLVGTFLVDRALFGEKSALGQRLKSRPMLKIAVEGSLGGGMVGSILKILFARYLDIAQRIGPGITLVHDEIKHFVEQEKAKKSDVEKAKTPNLAAFRSKSDEALTFREFVEVLTHLAQMLERDREAFNKNVTTGLDELKRGFEGLNALTKAGGVDLKKLKDDQARAMMIAMNAHAAQGIHDMLKGIDFLFAEIGGDQSVMSILSELGIDTGDLSKAQQAVHKAVEPKMEGFKKAEEQWKKTQARADAEAKQEDANAKAQTKATLEKIVGKPLTAK